MVGTGTIRYDFEKTAYTQGSQIIHNSFNKDFMQHMKSIFDNISSEIGKNNDVAIVLFTHLELEKAMNKVIYSFFRNPKRDTINRLSFNSKLNILNANDFFDNDIINTISHVNSVRNSFAHMDSVGKSKTLLNEDDVKVIEDKLQDRNRNEYKNFVSTCNGSKELSNAEILSMAVSFLIGVLNATEYEIEISDPAKPI